MEKSKNVTERHSFSFFVRTFVFLQYFIMSAQDYILEFNCDAENRLMMDFYKSKSMMEIMGKVRDENAHSAFLAWLFKGDDVATQRNNSPLMWLLQLLLKREGTAKSNPFSSPSPSIKAIKEKILNRTLKFEINEVQSQKPVKDVCVHNGKTNYSDFFDVNYHKQGYTDDKLDIYIHCSLHDCPGYDELEIIIENKILANEGGPKPKSKQKFVNQKNSAVSYDDQFQTVRYYRACQSIKSTSSNAKQKLQLFVFLYATPGSESVQKDYYIHINYQDVLDYILTPMMQANNVSERVKMLLKEYSDSLSIPTMDEPTRKRIVMAVSADEMRRLSSFKSRNKDFLLAICKAFVAEANNKTTPSDDLLISFAKSNKNLFYAVLNNNSTTSLDNLFEGRSKHLLILLPDFQICTDTDFGFEFARRFALMNQDNVSNVADLHQALFNQLGQKMTMYYGNNVRQRQNKVLPHYKFPLYITTGTWAKNGSGMLTRLLNALKSHPLQYFEFLEI